MQQIPICGQIFILAVLVVAVGPRRIKEMLGL